MENIAILNHRGVLSLPEDIQVELNLHRGSCLEVTVRDGCVVLRPLPVQFERELEKSYNQSQDMESMLFRDRAEDDEISRLKYGC